MTHDPLIAVTIGDPGGIGPEVVVKALSKPEIRQLARWVVVGNQGTLEAAAQKCGVEPCWREGEEPSVGSVVLRCERGWDAGGDFEHRPTARGGRASLDYLNAAIDLPRHEAGPWRADGVVTAPISKEAWVLSGETRYPGHTELFADRLESPGASMMFVADPAEGSTKAAGPRGAGLSVILATAHVPLMRVGAKLTTELVLHTIMHGVEAMRRLGHIAPRVGVCGLNPHAGEHGVLGVEDDEIIVPAIIEARTRGVRVDGPFPGDTIFPGGLSYADEPAPKFDLIVAMTHDQGLIPVKLLAFDRAVNTTVGLAWQGRSVVRTSPDHGTAFDIAGSGVADAGSMCAALRLAVRLSS